MPIAYEFAAGYVTGRSHRTSGKNNHDAYCVQRTPGCTVALVCDGCGSGAYSEVGAQLGARLITNSLLGKVRPPLTEEDAGSPLQGCDAKPTPGLLLEAVRCDVLDQLSVLAAGMGDCLPCVVQSYFLFTVVGVLITPLHATFFSIGDGALVINGESIALGPFPNNAPPYLAYDLVPSSLEMNEPVLLRFQIHRTLPTSKLQSFLIGTDGVHDLVNAAKRKLPGKTEPVGPLCQFWQDERYFSNPDMVRRRLAGVNRDVTAIRTVDDGPRPHSMLHKEAGLLHDDTTLIVGRRKKEVVVS